MDVRDLFGTRQAAAGQDPAAVGGIASRRDKLARFSAIRPTADAPTATDGSPVLDGRGGYPVPGL
ncbi:hypothetical protein GCM10010289_75580 [Streptomyces violascens]|nr:hypothetical protein GCM10010289_75580 [Streptomyces violascens]